MGSGNWSGRAFGTVSNLRAGDETAGRVKRNLSSQQPPVHQARATRERQLQGDGPGVQVLADRCPSLESLNLMCCSKVTDAGVQPPFRSLFYNNNHHQLTSASAQQTRRTRPSKRAQAGRIIFAFGACNSKPSAGEAERSGGGLGGLPRLRYTSTYTYMYVKRKYDRGPNVLEQQR